MEVCFLVDCTAIESTQTLLTLTVKHHEIKRMRVILLANSCLGWRVARWLKGQKDEIVGLVVHPPQKARFKDKIVQALALPKTRVFDGAKLRDSAILKRIKKLHADVAVSVLFGYILKDEFIQLFPKGVINLHPAYLPYNRGSFPNVWSIIENTPSGVTLHYIDAGIDTGDIIAQELVPVLPTDTGLTLYCKLEKAGLQLFRKTWVQISKGSLSRSSQPSLGTTHRLQDVESIDQIILDRAYLARDLINILRARTFPPHLGAYFEDNGKRVYLELKLTEKPG